MDAVRRDMFWLVGGYPKIPFALRNYASKISLQKKN